MRMCWELLLAAISSKPFFEQAADSSLDYYLDLRSITERRLLCFISSFIPSAISLILFLWYDFIQFMTVLLRFNKRPLEVFTFSFLRRNFFPAPGLAS